MTPVPDIEEVEWPGGPLCPDQGGTEVCDDCPPDCPCYGEET